MEPKDLVKVWDAPDHSKVTPKQISIRLPILAAAKIEAICEMYSSKTKTQIISDLIVTALQQVEDALPSHKGKYLGMNNYDLYDDPELSKYLDTDLSKPVNVGGIYEDIGPKGQFYRLTKKHLRALEKEAKIKEPISCPDPVIFESAE